MSVPACPRPKVFVVTPSETGGPRAKAKTKTGIKKTTIDLIFIFILLKKEIQKKSGYFLWIAADFFCISLGVIRR
jgi:hypothetical protein